MSAQQLKTRDTGWPWAPVDRIISKHPITLEHHIFWSTMLQNCPTVSVYRRQGRISHFACLLYERTTSGESSLQISTHYGYLWVPMGTYGTYGYLGVLGGTYGYLWVPRGTYRYLAIFDVRQVWCPGLGDLEVCTNVCERSMLCFDSSRHTPLLLCVCCTSTLRTYFGLLTSFCSAWVADHALINSHAHERKIEIIINWYIVNLLTTTSPILCYTTLCCTTLCCDLAWTTCMAYMFLNFYG